MIRHELLKISKDREETDEFLVVFEHLNQDNYKLLCGIMFYEEIFNRHRLFATQRM